MQRSSIVRSSSGLVFAALCVTALSLSCGDVDPTPLDRAASVDDAALDGASSAALVYAHEAGYCEDTDDLGVPYAPARPVWSDLDGPHYDGIVHTDGSTSIRYPDYENVSHNLAVLESLQFLLSMVQNISSRVESAQTFLEDEEYLDATYGLIPQVDGHCVCLDGGCDPATILEDAEDAVNELIDVQNIEDILTDYLTQKVDATIADLEDLVAYFEGLIDPSGGVVSLLEQAVYDAIEAEIAGAQANMIGPVADACDPSTWANPGELADAIEDAVIAAIAELEADFQADIATIMAAVDLAITTPGAVLDQLDDDLEEVLGYFEGVDSFGDLINLDWTALAETIENMVPYYEDTITDIQTAIDDVTEIWETAAAYVTRIETLGEDIYDLVMDELATGSANVQACVDAIEDAASYAAGFSPADFLDNLTDELTSIIEDTWDEAAARIEMTWQNIQDRITGIGLEDGLALFDAWAGDARALITSTLEACYMRGTRPECFDHCAASGATAQDDFIWMPVDFLQDPEALAAGAASGALFALEQTGWLDEIREWVATQMETDLGAAFTATLGVLGDFEESIENVIEFLGDAFAYVDLFTEGYHLGAYSELRPDLHMCIGYYGHGAYAQMGGLGGDNFSIGARYSSHNLSERHRVQFRSGGFAVSAFGYDLSLLPGIEFNTQMNGWKLWDQTRPFGIPMGATIDPDTVGRLDVFNVVPMDRYPFGLTEGVPIGAFLVRDLFPSRPTGFATPQWPRPGVDAEWESSSVAVMSLGLNLEFTWPADGPEYFELPSIPIIPGILTVIPSFGIQLGVGWVHDTNGMRERVLEMVNANIPPALQLSTDDFGRDMHAMQAPDLTADNQTFAFVEPSIAIEAFLGFKIWKIKVGAGARVALAVNIRPGGTGGLVDINAALGDALVNSNPPADAVCEPVWNWANTYECSNTAFPDSEGEFSCDPTEGQSSCCMTIELFLESGIERYSLCVDDWTGINEEYCDYLNLPGSTLEDAQEVIEGLPGFLSGLQNRLLNLIGEARRVVIRGEWRDGASCAERECGGGEFEEVFSTSGLNIQSLSECEQFGFCTYEDGSITHDTTLDQCESEGRSWIDVSTSTTTTCGIDSTGQLYCWGRWDYSAANASAVAYTQVTTVGNYACAIRADDQTVDCYRFSASFDLGQTSAPADTRFLMIRAGETHVCGITVDRGLECWGGSYNFGRGTYPRGEGWTVVESGYNRSCAIDGRGLLACFGEAVTPEYPFSDFRFQDVSMSSFLGVCGLRDGGGTVQCGQLDDTGFGGGSYCDADRYGAAPGGTFTDIEDQGPCSVCGRRPDGSVECWGEDPITSSFSGPTSLIAGYSHGGRVLCAVMDDASIECINARGEGFPVDEPSGIFSAYTCRTTTTPELEGWTGDGCHPLQHGFASACGCGTDADCAAGETCSAEGQCTDGTPSYSCVCGPGETCGAGRTCVDGACQLLCATDDDCADGRECVSGSCAPPHGVPTVEEILWGMQNLDAPTHLVSTYAMSDIYATLTLTTNLYVELSFKLFGKERKWRILDFNRGWDLGSTWKGWYQPGLEALYQDECENPLLDEPVTNRFPRSLTSNPYDGVFDADGITDALGICSNGGVCRYGDPLPASQDDPSDYAYGNVGDVDAFLTYCNEDYPGHVENPDHSSTDSIIDGIVDTYEFGYNVTLEIYAQNQFCVDGVLWDEWLAGLEPTLGEDGEVLDEGLLADYDCAYDDPTTGDTWTFSCGDITQEMLAIWGCLDADSTLAATRLAAAFPAIVTTHPDHGPIFDLDAMFVALPDNDPIYGSGDSFDLNLANMVAAYRFYDSPFPIVINNVGEVWLQQVDACFSDRFDSAEESACECASDADCVEANGERCSAEGVCEQPLYDSPDDDTPEWVQAFCPIVYLDAEVEQCCGDGVVQESSVEGGYAEECDDGPDGSDECTPDCRLRTPPVDGACCLGVDACVENLGAEDCAREGGVFNAGSSCADLDYCADDGDPDPDPIGACCTEYACLESMTELRCSFIGTWTEGASCEDVDFCEDTIIDYGACCTPAGCFEDIPEAECADRGDFYAGSSCADVDFCADIEPIGACCLPTGACAGEVTLAICDGVGGEWTEGGACDGDLCPAPILGACCLGDACVDGLDEAKCVEEGGDFTAGAGCDDAGICEGPILGACCLGDACVDGLDEAKCVEEGGDFTAGAGCDDAGICEVEPVGACCLGDTCIENVTAPVCERRGGDWSEGASCDDPGVCEADPVGACCLGDTCVENVTEVVCDRRGGAWSEDAACDEIECGTSLELGACCADGVCYDELPERSCERLGGEWTSGATCDDVPCGSGEPTGGCCLESGLCIDAVTEAECTAEGGVDWVEGTVCADCGCSVPDEGTGDGGVSSGGGSGGGCAAAPTTGGVPFGLALVGFGLAVLRRRR